MANDGASFLIPRKAQVLSTSLELERFFFRVSYDDRGDDFLVLFEQKESLLRKINTIKKKREKRNYSGFWFGKFAQKKKFVQNI